MLFFTLRPRPKVYFRRFSSFSRGGNAVFAVFYSSAAAESRFSPFSVRRTPTKGCFLPFFIDCTPTKRGFSRFLRFVDRRRAFFSVFRISSADNERFFAISAFRQPTTSVFLHFLALRGVGNTFFGVFHSSEASESHFLPFSTHPSPRKAIFPNFPLIRALGKPFFAVFHSSEPSDDPFFQFFASAAYRNLNRFLPPRFMFYE